MKKVAVVGASGYSGAELVRILGRHREVELTHLFAQTAAGQRFSSLYPQFAISQNDLLIESWNESKALEADIIFMALPAGEAMQLAPALIKADKLVIDLSGDHRLTDTALYGLYYGIPAAPVESLDVAEYAFPEWSASKLPSARLISNPGCYATSIILPLLPLVKAGLIELERVVINSMSGTSGAGRKGTLDLSFSEVNESVKAYRVGDHQHTPEIEMALEKWSGTKTNITFVPHLIPITRGIYSTISAQLKAGISGDAIKAAFVDAYSAAPFVRMTDDKPPEIKHVANTNFIDIGYKVLEAQNEIIIMSAIDNLVKGAAGQAVQNMNIACGFRETEGLL